MENAVLIQIWAALITMLVLITLKAIAKYDWHLTNLRGIYAAQSICEISLQLWLDKPFEQAPDRLGNNIYATQVVLF